MCYTEERSEKWLLFHLSFCLFVAYCSAPDTEGVCAVSWLSLVSSCCFVICGRSLIISPGRQLGCSGTQLLPVSSVSPLQTSHCGSPRICELCYFFCLTCSGNPSRLFDPHTSSLSLLFMMEWGYKLSLRPFNRSLCPYHLPSHPAVFSDAYSIGRVIVLWCKDPTCKSAIAYYCDLVCASGLQTVSHELCTPQG